MKNTYQYILAIIICAFICSCESQINELYTVANGRKLELIGVPADFSRMNVDSRATADQENEINDLTMFIFNSQGNLAGKAFKVDGNVLFTIDLENGNVIYGNELVSLGGDDYLGSCTVYMFANVWSDLNGLITDKGSDLIINDLLDKQISVNSVDIPTNGFPMMGNISGVDLSKDATSASLNVPLEKLFAKVNVMFQVSANQVDQTPTFKLNNWSVYNVPNKIKLRKPYGNSYQDNLTETEAANDINKVFNSASFNKVSNGQSQIQHTSTLDGSSMFTLTFYVPEHVVLPTHTENTYPFPDGLLEAERQRYKPKMFDTSKCPTYVLVDGEYTDHYGQLTRVQYRLYLGQDNTDDFSIFRNQQLDNNVVIRGLTNSTDAFIQGDEDNISVDHRVNIPSRGYSVAIERETFFDSHFEFRPIDISVKAGAKITLEIENDIDDTEDDWIRFDNQEAPQDYFYEDLVRSRLAGNTSFTLDNTTGTTKKSQRIWVYVDENTQHYDKLVPKENTNDPRTKTYREKTINVSYYENSTAQPQIYHYHFRQMNLWRIWGGAGIDSNIGKNRYYDIEYHEEYLYNYASDDNWGKTTDGMPWGFSGTTFSGNMGEGLKTQAMLLDVSSMSDLTEGIGKWVIEQASPFYDFYLPKEAKEISEALENPENAFAGRRFNNGMIGYKLNANELKLNEDPENALEYCLNKNKRSEAGIVTRREWYLPAIDELEEIMVGGYSDFAVFQDKMYWSCQPAYHRSWVHYKTVDRVTAKDYEGAYYFENSLNARATSAKYVGKVNNIDTYTYTGSGAVNDGYFQYFPVSVSNTSGAAETINGVKKYQFKYDSEPGFILHGSAKREERTLKQIEYDEGYKGRNEINRVRCVRKSGYETKPGS